MGRQVNEVWTDFPEFRVNQGLKGKPVWSAYPESQDEPEKSDCLVRTVLKATVSLANQAFPVPKANSANQVIRACLVPPAIRASRRCSATTLLSENKAIRAELEIGGRQATSAALERKDFLVAPVTPVPLVSQGPEGTLESVCKVNLVSRATQESKACLGFPDCPVFRVNRVKLEYLVNQDNPVPKATVSLASQAKRVLQAVSGCRGNRLCPASTGNQASKDPKVSKATQAYQATLDDLV